MGCDVVGDIERVHTVDADQQHPQAAAMLQGVSPDCQQGGKERKAPHGKARQSSHRASLSPESVVGAKPAMFQALCDASITERLGAFLPCPPRQGLNCATMPALRRGGPRHFHQWGHFMWKPSRGPTM